MTATPNVTSTKPKCVLMAIANPGVSNYIQGGLWKGLAFATGGWSQDSSSTPGQDGRLVIEALGA